MKPVNRQTDDELAFNANDITEAIRANLANPKIYQYLIERDQIRVEQVARERKRIYRRELRENLFDHLALGGCFRWRWRNKEWTRNSTRRAAWRSAAWLAGWYRLYGI